MDSLSAKEIGALLAGAAALDLEPVGVYGSDAIPEEALLSASVSDCLASNIYQIASGRIDLPVYAGSLPGREFCRCIGGPAWFGYDRFDLSLSGLMSTGSAGAPGKCLKESSDLAGQTYGAVGEVKPLGRFVVAMRCRDIPEDQSIECLVCFAGGQKIRDLCALAHFSSHEVFDLVCTPWGPACATLVTYPAGMAENASRARIYLGPTDPSARQWLPVDLMAIGIPAEIALKMARSAGKSFLAGR